MFGSSFGTAVLLPHSGIATVQGEQFLMSASFNDGPLMKDNDLIGMRDGRQTMAGGGKKLAIMAEKVTNR